MVSGMPYEEFMQHPALRSAGNEGHDFLPTPQQINGWPSPTSRPPTKRPWKKSRSTSSAIRSTTPIACPAWPAVCSPRPPMLADFARCCSTAAHLTATISLRCGRPADDLHADRRDLSQPPAKTAMVLGFSPAEKFTATPPPAAAELSPRRGLLDEHGHRSGTSIGENLHGSARKRYTRAEGPPSTLPTFEHAADEAFGKIVELQ